LPLGSPLIDSVFRGSDRERAYARGHCGHSDIRGPDQSSSAPPHFLVTEGGVDEAGVFHKLPRLDDSRLAEIFCREVLAFLVGKELLSPEWAERILSWRHTGFSVHSLVMAKTKPEAERVGEYMIRPLLSLKRLSLDEREAKVCYRYGKDAE